MNAHAKGERPYRERRCRRKAAAPTVRTMDLLGMAEDGGVYLWQADTKVQPLSRFPMEGGRIVPGHYVIQERGHAVTAHCGNTGDPFWITVQIMCRGIGNRTLPRACVEADLLGQVLKDERDAEILAMLRQMTADQVARQQAPHRKRGQA